MIRKSEPAKNDCCAAVSTSAFEASLKIPKFVFVILFIATVFSGRAEVIVLPASTEGNAQSSSGLNRGARTYQFVYDASFLSTLPSGSAITGLSFRLNAAAIAAWPSAERTWANYDIQISASIFEPGFLSSTFADNIGADAVLVRSGALTIPAQTYAIDTSPRPFGISIDFPTPYVYQGSDLLVTIRHTGNGADHEFLDANVEAPSFYQGMLGGGYAQTVGSSSYIVPVIQFTYTVPEPASITFLLCGVLLCTRRRSVIPLTLLRSAAGQRVLPKPTNSAVNFTRNGTDHRDCFDSEIYPHGTFG